MEEKEAHDMGWEEFMENKDFDGFIDKINCTMESGLIFEVFMEFLRNLNVRPEKANDALYHAMMDWDI